MAKKQQAATDETVTVKDSLAEVLADALNKKFKDHRVAYLLDGKEWTPTDVDEWVSSGSSMLDIAIANRPNGGFPVGRITELTGLEGAGKSLIAAHALADTQRKGGLAILIDTEAAVNAEFFEAIGLDTSKLLYIHQSILEDIWDTLETIVEKIRSSDKKRLVTIVVDSLAGAATRREIEGDFDKDGFNTDKAIVNSKAMRKITGLIARERICVILTNQLRQKVGIVFGDPWTTSGGKAVAYHASVRLRVKPVGQLKVKVGGKDMTVGIKTQAQVIKNRMGPPLRSAEFSILFDSGIDDNGSWLEVMKNAEMLEQSGAWYRWIDIQTGEEVKFLSKDFEEKILGDPERKQRIYEAICNHLILKYRSEDLEIVESDEVIQD
jgi:recombination protein RecA